MSRWIDADKLMKNVDKYPYAQGLMDLIADIQTAPSIDICFCRECKHRRGKLCGRRRYSHFISLDDFCSYGEKE